MVKRLKVTNTKEELKLIKIDVDKLLVVLNYGAIALLYIVSLFALFTWITEMNKDTKELVKEYPLETKGTNTYTGYIIRKYKYKGIPSIEVVGYGRFVISEEEFNKLDVGTMVPDYIAMRSQDGKAKEEHKTVKKD